MAHFSSWNYWIPRLAAYLFLNYKCITGLARPHLNQCFTEKEHALKEKCEKPQNKEITHSLDYWLNLLV